MAFTLIYCYDPYCGWCYGFSPVINRLAMEYAESFSIEVLSGGMILPETPVHISAIAFYIQKAYKMVEDLSGVEFGDDYLWHIFNPDKSDWFPNSEKPSIALTILKESFPERQLEFATDLQYALHYEGRDLCDDESYRHLLQKYQLADHDFYEKLSNPLYKEKTRHEFSLVKHLKVTGYPTVFIQLSETKFHLLSRGYTDFDTMKMRIDNVLRENKIAT